jgi:hypothetical protein
VTTVSRAAGGGRKRGRDFEHHIFRGMSYFLLFVSPEDNDNVYCSSTSATLMRFLMSSRDLILAFGLSYTEFDYSVLRITVVNGGQDHDTQLEANWLAGLMATAHLHIVQSTEHGKCYPSFITSG